MRKLKHITTICREIYEKKGQSAVHDFVNEQLEKKNGAFKDVTYKECQNGCESKTPHWHDTCLVCQS